MIGSIVKTHRRRRRHMFGETVAELPPRDESGSGCYAYYFENPDSPDPPEFPPRRLH